MNKKNTQKSFNWGILGLIVGILAILLLIIVPIIAFPFIVITIIFSAVGIGKNSSIHAKVGLGLGIFGVIALFVIGFIGFDYDLYLSSSVNLNEETCNKLNEVQCLNKNDICSLCSESVEMSYAGCHSKEFCEGVQNFDPRIESIQYVKSMPEFTDYNGRELKIVNFTRSRCMGCYIVELEFFMDSNKISGEVDKAKYTIIISDWEIVESVSAFEVLDENLMNK